MKTSNSIKQILSHEVDPAFAQRSTYILNAIKKHKPAKILDAGCGRGFYIKLFSYLTFPKKIVGIDISETYTQKAKTITQNDKRVEVAVASIYKLPFKDNYFDCVVCSEVLEHLDDDLKALQELRRVLKPNGILLITVPHNRFPLLWDPLNWFLMKLFRTHINKNIWWLAGIWADHERLYEKTALKKVLKKAKLSPKPIKNVTNWCWPFSHFMLYGIGKNLVERGSTPGFDRFNFTKDNFLAKFLARSFALPSSVLDKKINTRASVNLFVEVKK